jgi:hypothetical protein
VRGGDATYHSLVQRGHVRVSYLILYVRPVSLFDVRLVVEYSSTGRIFGRSRFSFFAQIPSEPSLRDYSRFSGVEHFVR